MKFTKLMALALVLVMVVAAFVACGEPAETKPDSTSTPTTTDTEKPETVETTEPVETACTHKNSLKKTGNDKDPTCTEEGYIERQCAKCGEKVYEAIEKLPHNYSEIKSVDGKYTKKVCSMCKEIVIVDENDTVVTDTSAIVFPMLSATFEGVDQLDDIANLFEGFAFTPKFANIVKNDPSGDIYLNIPSGDVLVAPNGYLELSDLKNQLVGQAFTLKFSMKFEELPTALTAMLTWTVDGNAQTLLSLDSNGKYTDATGKAVADCKGKGWDNFTVEFAADGSYTISLEDAKIAEGKVVTTGSTSVFRFMDDKNQFEGYLDSIIVSK